METIKFPQLRIQNIFLSTVICLLLFIEFETIKESMELSGHNLSNEKIKSLIRTTFDEIECDGWWSDIEYFMQREVE